MPALWRTGAGTRDTEGRLTMATAVIVLLVVIAIGGALAAARNRPDLTYDEPALLPPSGGFDVTVVRIGIDGRASTFVQTELEAIAKTYDVTQEESRARSLREITIMLRRVRDSWVYGGAANEPTRPRHDALAAYARLVDDAKSRPQQTATDPGEPIILVSLVIASRGELMTLTDVATGEDLRRALEAALHRPASDLIAFDVSWRSASSLDLEATYRASELHRLQGSIAGKKHCTFCGGPFPAELVSCPHCGAPAREQGAS